MTTLHEKLKAIFDEEFDYDYSDTLIKQIEQAFIDDGWSNKPYGTGEISFAEKAMNEGYMTGQEWYDRFMKELWLAYQGGRKKTDSQLLDKVKPAAKRAAGIEVEHE